MAVLALIIGVSAVAAIALLLYEGRERHQRLEERLARMDGRLDANLQATADRMKVIGADLQAVRDSAVQILDVGRSISGLQDILRAPKLRGGFGEMLLERLLAQVLPEKHYAFQHRFRNGEIVDAIVDLGVAMVPVDAKFPMESFERMAAAEAEDERSRLRREFARAVRGHIDAVSKYIRPDEGTFDFALMYVPAENVYYETIVKGEAEGNGTVGLVKYALERRVIPVSPNCFYAYLQAIVLGLKGLHVERQAQVILGMLGRLNGDFARFQGDFDVLGRHLSNAKNKYDEVGRQVERFKDRLAVSVAGTEAEERGGVVEPAGNGARGRGME